MLEKMVINVLEENKEEIVDYLNQKINIPLIGEKAEAKILSSCVDASLEAIETVLSKK
jgi:hypothetical protein|tara:strand:+ start:20899 stop:21072 length:174 start_codon:yes stop_codon:yes gene_type:complete